MGSAIGVFAVGAAGATLGGSVLGGFVGIGLVASSDTESAIIGGFALPIVGATIAFNPTREWDDPSGPALLNMRDGSASLGPPVRYAIESSAGVTTPAVALVGGSF